jgi:hypothetical protein
VMAFSASSQMACLGGCEVTGYFQMELDKGPVAGMAGPQVVQPTRLGAGLHLNPDVLALLERQLAIERLLQRLGPNPATALEHISGDGQRESHVGAFPAGEPDYAKRGEHSYASQRGCGLTPGSAVHSEIPPRASLRPQPAPCPRQ